MIKVIGVRFRTAGKIYFFDPKEFEIKRGDHVIVETARGIEFGTVMSGVTEVEDEKVVQPLKPVLRIATERDVQQEATNKEKEKEAFRVCLEKIRQHELDMKLIDAEYTFDNNKVLFYFTADGRIDFRELVKDLAAVFKTRIELRQIGVRDETKIRGGIGICGRPLCCHSYLADFVPVSIKMAKEQNLSLNPTKISGVCGRLMCCLKNEEETYEELNRNLPNVGETVTAEDGAKGEVHSVNVLRQLVKIIVETGDTKEIKEYPVDQLQFKHKGAKKEKELTKEELKELEGLEDAPAEEAEKPERREHHHKEHQKEQHREGHRKEQSGEKQRKDEQQKDYQKKDHHHKDGQQRANQQERQPREGQKADVPRREEQPVEGQQKQGQQGASNNGKKHNKNHRNRRNRNDRRNRQEGNSNDNQA